MPRHARIIGLTLLLAAAAQAQVQRPVQWISNLEQGVAQARKVELPLMFYVTGNAGDSSDNDLVEAQQNAFRDPLVVGIAESRFVPVRLAISTQTASMLEKLGGSSSYGNYLIFAAPDMSPLGMLAPTQVANKTSLAQQLTQIFRKYRKQLYDQQIKPRFENAEASEAELGRLLKKIEKMLIIEADAGVVKLVESGRLTKATLKQAYDALALLSTPPAVDALFKAAMTDKLAETALNKCTPAAAELLLPKFNSESDDEFLLAYQAMIKICNLGKPKPRGFWFGKNDRLIDEELDRVEKGVKKAAQQWRSRYEAYR